MCTKVDAVYMVVTKCPSAFGYNQVQQIAEVLQQASWTVTTDLLCLDQEEGLGKDNPIHML